jgi:hypothetical protein
MVNPVPAILPLTLFTNRPTRTDTIFVSAAWPDCTWLLLTTANSCIDSDDLVARFEGGVKALGDDEVNEGLT